MKVHILIASGGDYSSSWESICGVFASKEAAERVKVQLIADAKEVQDAYNKYQNALEKEFSILNGRQSRVEERVGWITTGPGKEMYQR